MSGRQGEPDQYRVLFERTPQPAWVYDLESLRFLAVNEAAIERYGYSRAEFLTMTIEDIRPSEDLPRLADNLAAYRSGYEAAGRWRHVTRSGRLLDVEIVSVDVTFEGRRAKHVLTIDAAERMRTEAELRTSAALNDAFLGSALDCVVTIDGSGRIVDFNPAAEQVFGYSQAEAIGADMGELLVPERLYASYLRGLEELSAPGGAPFLDQRLELSARRRDGSEFPVELTIARLGGADPPLFTGFLRDVSERAAAREEIERLIRDRDQVLDAVDEGIYRVDTGGRITYANPAATAMLGYEWKELDGESAHEVFHHSHPDGRAYAMKDCPIHAAFRDGAVHRVSGEVFWRRDGSSFPVEYTSAPVRKGRQLVGAVCSFRDVTERRRAEDELRHNADEIRDLYDNAPCGYHSLDAEGRFAQVNATELRWLGYRHNEVVGRMTFPDVLTAESRVTYATAFPQLLAGDPVRDLELELVKRDGETMPVLLSATSILDRNGRFLSTRATVFDVTDLVRARRQQARLERQLHQSQRLESLGHLAGGVAHDFNNLLTVILNCGLYVRDEIADPELRDQVGEIVRAAERGADLTRQLLVFSRQGTAATDVFDVEQVLSDTERLLRRTLGENIELNTAISPEASQVRLGQGQLEQILINLSVNARDAMPDGGMLTIATSAIDIARDDSASFQGLAPGRYVQLTVADTGCGMSPEVVAQAFDPFYTTKPTGEGTGLGLATVYGIVKQAGGEARLYSEAGLGTTVKVYLPLASESPLPDGGLEPQPGTPTGEGRTVLIVEDESSVRTVTARILAAHGYRVLQASGPLEALALGSQHQHEIDLLLTDVVMPQMAGVELAERLRHDAPDLPVVFMSGYTGEVVLRQGVDQTETRLLEKPFTADALIAAVKDALATADAGARGAHA